MVPTSNQSWAEERCHGLNDDNDTPLSEGQWTQNNIYKNISHSQEQILVNMLMRVRHGDCEWI